MSDLRDEYGNPIRRTDEYGNPICHDEYESYQSGPMGITTKGSTGMQPGVTGVGIGGGHQQHEHASVDTGVLHRSGSSSSSEDDGHGGRRKKKGLKEKIKEKLPGGHKHEHEQEQGYTAGYGTAPGHVEHEHEKKGVMEKIKEKLPGHHHKEQSQY